MLITSLYLNHYKRNCLSVDYMPQTVCFSVSNQQLLNRSDPLLEFMKKFTLNMYSGV